METLIHVMHVVAIKDAHAWIGMTPAQLSMLGFWNLIFVWLKVRRTITAKYHDDTNWC
jgi:protein-cysteine N-palmitoyltransferase HHAT